jgi:hypothetical protein
LQGLFGYQNAYTSRSGNPVPKSEKWSLFKKAVLLNDIVQQKNLLNTQQLFTGLDPIHYKIRFLKQDSRILFYPVNPAPKNKNRISLSDEYSLHT